MLPPNHNPPLTPCKALNLWFCRNFRGQMSWSQYKYYIIILGVQNWAKVDYVIFARSPIFCFVVWNDNQGNYLLQCWQVTSTASFHILTASMLNCLSSSPSSLPSITLSRLSGAWGGDLRRLFGTFLCSSSHFLAQLGTWIAMLLLPKSLPQR